MLDSGGTQLYLSTGQVEGEVVVTFRDTGSGIDTAHLHRIYDPFFTTKNTPKEGQHKGTGLGLAVSYGIEQEHAGRIQLESTVGEGTTFRLFFPALPAAGDSPAKAETTQSPAAEARTVNA